VLPAASVTLLAVAFALLQTPTRTTRRLPAVMFAVGVRARLVALIWPRVCCTNAGVTAAAVGVTVLEAVEAVRGRRRWWR
jgi:hypothetical protein